MTEQCIKRQHDACSGYTEPESDPELCECECHEDATNSYLEA